MTFLVPLLLAAAVATGPAGNGKPASAPATKAATAAPATQAGPDAQAQDPNAPKEKSWYNYGLLGWYVEGEWFMVPLFLCQVIGLGVIIERLGAYRAIRIDTSAFREKVKELLSAGHVDQAIELCDSTPGPIAATLAVGLRRFKFLIAIGKPVDQLESDVEKAIDDYGQHMVAVLEQHVPILASIVALGPLFGFLGTVQGMVAAFAAIEAAAGSGNIIQITAAGIKTALFTTILGLCVGIVAQLFYNLFTSKVNDTVLDVAESATDLIQNLTIMTAAGAIDGDGQKQAAVAASH